MSVCEKMANALNVTGIYYSKFHSPYAITDPGYMDFFYVTGKTC